MTPRTSRIATGLAAVALLLSAPALSADGFSDTVILRTAPGGRSLYVGDIAANGSTVVVGWGEGGGWDDPTTTIRYKVSTHGGRTFDRSDSTLSASRDIALDTCVGWVAPRWDGSPLAPLIPAALSRATAWWHPSAHTSGVRADPG